MIKTANHSKTRSRPQRMIPITLSIVCLALSLGACNQSGQESHKREIKPAVKLSTDASQVAAAIDQFLQGAESVVLSTASQPEQLETRIFNPVRQLLLRWNTEIKQSDSVVGDQYTICRGALISLDSWARAVQNHTPGQVDKQTIFARQKALCAQAVQAGAHQTQPNASSQ